VPFLLVVGKQCMFSVNYNNIKGNGVVQLPESALKLMDELDEASDRGRGHHVT
jgi:hypothetical protein